MLKKLILIGALIAIVPLDRESQQHIYQIAKATVIDVGGFCDRNPNVCATGKTAISRFTDKAEAGAKMVVDLVNEQNANGDSTPAMDFLSLNTPKPVGIRAAALPSPVRSNDRLPAYRNQYNDHYGARANTLLASDLEPSWRGTTD
jgi:hypothetical protein